jgi:hypothetical protein
MKKIIFSLLVTLLFSPVSEARWIESLVNDLNRYTSTANHILSDSLIVQRDVLRSQQDIDRLIQQLNQTMIGHTGWGKYQVQDYLSYGQSANDWRGVLSMIVQDQRTGRLGQVMNELAQQFPLSQVSFNRGVHDTETQHIYALKARTILATRAASQLDYDTIQTQFSYQQMLRQQIDKTADIKAAMDLSNRIHIEGNLILLAILRQAALATQQQAVIEQTNIQSNLANARFLTKP